MREDLKIRLEQFKERYSVDAAVQSRITKPPVEFIGREIFELAVAALLQGENLLLCGGKATGKNILADNLAWLFARPIYNVSFHVNTDSSALIGTDTFVGGEVRLRHGPIAQAAKCGGFCILDEINMAKNDAVAVMHSVLDYRRLIDVPGYECIPMHPATRFIATMNYGYAGTRELNEALISRFAVLDLPLISQDDMNKLLRHHFPQISSRCAGQFVQLFYDLHKKADSAEISARAVDLRGLLDALRLIEHGLDAAPALDLCITNKTFDPYEQALIRDVIAARIPKNLNRAKVFPG